MFDSSRCEVRQKIFISNKYVVYEGDDPVLSTKQKKFKLKKDFRLNGHDIDEERFRVKADSALDVSTAYDIVDSRTDERVDVVKRGTFSFAKHTCQLLGPDGSVAGRIVEDGVPVAVARRLVTTLAPFSYRIEDAAGEEVGAVGGRFSLRDKHTVDVDRERIDLRLAVVGAVVIGTIEEN